MSKDSASNSDEESNTSKVGRPTQRSRRTPGAMHRTAVYMSGEVLNTISDQAELEGNSKSGLNSDLLELLLISPIGQKLRKITQKTERRSITQELAELLQVILLSPIGQKLQKSADINQVSLAVELEKNLNFFKEEIPIKALADLAKRSGKTPEQVLAELINVVVNPSFSEKLEASAIYNGRTLAQEVEKNLILFKERIPYEEIVQLAEATQRTPDDMIARLALIGLETYKQRNLADSE